MKIQSAPVNCSPKEGQVATWMTAQIAPGMAEAAPNGLALRERARRGHLIPTKHRAHPPERSDEQ